MSDFFGVTLGIRRCPMCVRRTFELRERREMLDQTIIIVSCAECHHIYGIADPPLFVPIWWYADDRKKS